jgi:hypothetical protein
MSDGAPLPSGPGRRFLLVYVAPVLILLAWKALPLAIGRDTLYLRDVFNTHLGMKWAEAEALRQGHLPLLDPYRAGGQPLLGNPNAVPLYPDDLLYLLSSTIWSLNAHFWIHLLLAPLAFYWMARAWGLGREPAWASGVCYALCGYYLSHLSFYSMIAGVTLAPCLVASLLRWAEGRSRRMAAAAGAVWALLLLGGDPFIALLALLLAASALVVLHGWRVLRSAAPLVAGLACGTLAAAPQIVEFLRVLRASLRGVVGFSRETITLASWDPRQAVEWILPLVFGRVDRMADGAFWGHRFFTDRPPYYLSLYPGLLALALIAAAGRPRARAAGWAWGTVAVGLFIALGRFNPLGSWIFAVGGGLLRYPVRLWLLVAVGGALLAGNGFERAVVRGDPAGRRSMALALLGLGLALGFFWLALTLFPGPAEAWMRGVIPSGFTDAFVAAERRRWAGIAGASLLVLALLALGLFLARLRPAAGGAVILVVHAAAQLFLLAPLAAADAVAPYLAPSPILDLVPRGARLVHAPAEALFGLPAGAPPAYPDGRALWQARRAFHEVQPAAGALAGRRYELNVSSEGMDSFLTTAARDAVRLATDAERIRMLAAWGVEFLLIDREIPPEPGGGLHLVRSVPSFGRSIHLYALDRPAPEAQVVGGIRRAPSVNAAVDILKRADFDPLSTVVLPGNGLSIDGPPGRATILASGPESIAVAVDAPTPGVLVVQRAHQPLYRAFLDGRPVPIEAANLHRLGVAVPPGRHRIEIRTDRRPLRRSLLAALAGLAGLAALGRRPRANSAHRTAP